MKGDRRARIAPSRAALPWQAVETIDALALLATKSEAARELAGESRASRARLARFIAFRGSNGRAAI